uniref:uncharacterized protein LOC105352351 n=1 Tax=Fragaria vesca subsp. vesca TaxID=101020 RepID=UPI0005C9F90E|nr:PREDICTED: uncharacterized protein LOC105352351 [Fragaria vesca subsp. vesca]
MSMQDFIAAFTAFGHAVKLDPANGLYMQSLRNAAVAYTINRAPHMIVLLYNQAPGPLTVAAVPFFIEGLTYYLERDYLSSIRSFTNARFQDPTNGEIAFYVRTAAEGHLAAVVPF